MTPDIPTLLIVDDNPNNLRVLEGILQNEGYKVRAALNGEAALRAAESAVPDLILLDIRMPGMEGYEVCRRLKQTAHGRDIPVIFISALQEMDDKVHAFQAGGVDYIVKPFQAEEVLARARTHIELSRARRALAASNERLELLVGERTAELAESNRQLERTAREEHVLRELLALSHRHRSLHNYLREALASLVITADWRAPTVKSAILLANIEAKEGNEGGFELAAAEGFAPGLAVPGRRLPLHSCIKADAAICVEHAGVDQPCYLRSLLGESTTDQAMCVTLASEGKVLGVLLLVTAAGAEGSAGRDSFLQQVADVLATSIARRHADDQIAWLAYHDDLTGLPNRRHLAEQLGRELPNATRRGYGAAVMIIDLDHFKRLNDALGHAIGDQFLKAVAERLRLVIRAEDSLFHWGGDEFVVTLADLAGDEAQAATAARTTAAKIAARLGAPMRVGEQDAHMAASIGIAMFPGDGVTAEELIKHADLAMHQAKEAGRDAIHFYKVEMQNQAERRLVIEKDLRAALVAQQFLLYYQPQVDGDGRIIGGEALIRWQHPARGMVPPGEFIATAEEMGLIVPLGEWVLRTACEQLRGWKVEEGRTLAINVSPRQFHQDDFVDQVRRVIEASGVPPASIELEVTESLLLTDVDGAVRKMNALREFGLRFSVDDFGTGYSSLAYLRQLPVDQLKIDRSFVTDVHLHERNAAIVRTIISLARNLGMKTIAEGVEQVEEVDFLRAAGCDHFQGYYFGKPMPAENFSRRWATGTSSGA